jgi:hypothetical protein
VQGSDLLVHCCAEIGTFAKIGTSELKEFDGDMHLISKLLLNLVLFEQYHNLLLCQRGAASSR